MNTQKILAFLVIVLAALALSAFITVKPNHAPETVLPTITEFDGGRILVTWWMVPQDFVGVDGVVYLEGINGYRQAVVLKPVEYFGEIGKYTGYPQPVPQTGTYYLSYGYFHTDDESYPIAFLPSDPITITLHRSFLPMLTR